MCTSSSFADTVWPRQPFPSLQRPNFCYRNHCFYILNDRGIRSSGISPANSGSMTSNEIGSDSLCVFLCGPWTPRTWGKINEIRWRLRVSWRLCGRSNSPVYFNKPKASQYAVESNWQVQKIEWQQAQAVDVKSGTVHVVMSQFGCVCLQYTIFEVSGSEVEDDVHEVQKVRKIVEAEPDDQGFTCTIKVRTKSIVIIHYWLTMHTSPRKLWTAFWILLIKWLP